MTTKTFGVTGMTCGHCANAVTQELTAIAGVTAVEVDVAPGEVSQVTVTSASELSNEDVAAAIDEAGYELAGS